MQFAGHVGHGTERFMGEATVRRTGRLCTFNPQPIHGTIHTCHEHGIRARGGQKVGDIVIMGGSECSGPSR